MVLLKDIAVLVSFASLTSCNPIEGGPGDVVAQPDLGKIGLPASVQLDRLGSADSPSKKKVSWDSDVDKLYSQDKGKEKQRYPSPPRPVEHGPVVQPKTPKKQEGRVATGEKESATGETANPKLAVREVIERGLNNLAERTTQEHGFVRALGNIFSALHKRQDPAPMAPGSDAPPPGADAGNIAAGPDAATPGVTPAGPVGGPDAASGPPTGPPGSTPPNPATAPDAAAAAGPPAGAPPAGGPPLASAGLGLDGAASDTPPAPGASGPTPPNPAAAGSPDAPSAAAGGPASPPALGAGTPGTAPGAPASGTDTPLPPPASSADAPGKLPAAPGQPETPQVSPVAQSGGNGGSGKPQHNAQPNGQHPEHKAKQNGQTKEEHYHNHPNGQNKGHRQHKKGHKKGHHPQPKGQRKGENHPPNGQSTGENQQKPAQNPADLQPNNPPQGHTAGGFSTPQLPQQPVNIPQAPQQNDIPLGSTPPPPLGAPFIGLGPVTPPPMPMPFVSRDTSHLIQARDSNAGRRRKRSPVQTRFQYSNSVPSTPNQPLGAMAQPLEASFGYKAAGAAAANGVIGSNPSTPEPRLTRSKGVRKSAASTEELKMAPKKGKNTESKKKGRKFKSWNKMESGDKKVGKKSRKSKVNPNHSSQFKIAHEMVKMNKRRAEERKYLMAREAYLQDEWVKQDLAKRDAHASPEPEAYAYAEPEAFAYAEPEPYPYAVADPEACPNPYACPESYHWTQ